MFWQIEELEGKLRRQEALSYSKKLEATPLNSRVETIQDMDSASLKSLNSNDNNRRMSMGSDLLKGTDSLRELRRKRQIQSKGTENNFLLTASLVEKKLLTGESNKVKHVDPSKALARMTRSTKAVSATTQRTFPTGSKEGSSKLKTWLR